eukprot:363159-Chlamydomonas_euryale.AAC.1
MQPRCTLRHAAPPAPPSMTTALRAPSVAEDRRPGAPRAGADADALARAFQLARCAAHKTSPRQTALLHSPPPSPCRHACWLPDALGHLERLRPAVPAAARASPPRSPRLHIIRSSPSVFGGARTCPTDRRRQRPQRRWGSKPAGC